MAKTSSYKLYWCYLHSLDRSLFHDQKGLSTCIHSNLPTPVHNHYRRLTLKSVALGLAPFRSSNGALSFTKLSLIIAEHVVRLLPSDTVNCTLLLLGTGDGSDKLLWYTTARRTVYRRKQHD